MQTVALGREPPRRACHEQGASPSWGWPAGVRPAEEANPSWSRWAVIASPSSVQIRPATSRRSIAPDDGSTSERGTSSIPIGCRCRRTSTCTAAKLGPGRRSGIGAPTSTSTVMIGPPTCLEAPGEANHPRGTAAAGDAATRCSADAGTGRLNGSATAPILSSPAVLRRRRLVRARRGGPALSARSSPGCCGPPRWR